MSIKTSCPNCGFHFEIDEKYEEFEKLAAQMVNGNIAPKQTSGYDVYDRLNIKYQVKHSTAHKSRKSSYWTWHFYFRPMGNYPDYFILYGIDNNDTFCFLLSARKFIEKSSIKGRHWKVDASISLSSWIWDYRVTHETFESKLNLLLTTGEFMAFLDKENDKSIKEICI